MGNLLEVTDQNFQEKVLEAEKPVLVDMWAVWCTPCRNVAPIIEQLADEYKDQITVGKMDVDSNPSTPVKYGVQGIPTCILFKGGEEVARIVGARPKPQFLSMLEPFVE